MELKLENLIEKIKKEGIEEAQQTSDSIINKAKQEAALIIEDKKKEAEKIIDDAKQEAQKFKQNAELAVQQAARDTELLIKEKLTNLFDRVFKKEVSNTLTPDFLNKLISKIVNKWADSPNAEITVAEKDKKKLEDLLFSSLKGEIKESITIKASSNLGKGFRIGLKDGQVYYDFSDDSIADVLKNFLNPRIKEILDEKDG
jgi:V/A-type H+-transporting ATPase subunit E